MDGPRAPFRWHPEPEPVDIRDAGATRAAPGGRGRDDGRRRHAGIAVRSLAVRSLAVAVLVWAAAGPVALADETPLPSAGATEVDANPDPAAEPAFPYIVALLVTSAGLAVVGFVAMRVNRPRRVTRRPGTGWWTCASCAAGNAPDRTTCFACQAPRGPAGGGGAMGT
jgi:hypothetical protein